MRALYLAVALLLYSCFMVASCFCFCFCLWLASGSCWHALLGRPDAYCTLLRPPAVSARRVWLILSGWFGGKYYWFEEYLRAHS